MTDPRYPNGKLNDEDEGEATLMVTEENGVVVVAFQTPTRWIGLPPEHAVELAALLIKRARAIDPNVKVPLPSYQIIENGKAIQCFHCGAISHSRTDVAMRYCGRCHKFLESR